MHTLWLGVAKQFMTRWMKSNKFLTEEEKEILSKRISLLKMPMGFSRRPRPWGDGSWKGIVTIYFNVSGRIEKLCHVPF
jgi:hypothetical protein